MYAALRIPTGHTSAELLMPLQTAVLSHTPSIVRATKMQCRLQRSSIGVHFTKANWFHSHRSEEGLSDSPPQGPAHRPGRWTAWPARGSARRPARPVAAATRQGRLKKRTRRRIKGWRWRVQEKAGGGQGKAVDLCRLGGQRVRSASRVRTDLEERAEASSASLAVARDCHAAAPSLI